VRPELRKFEVTMTSFSDLVQCRMLIADTFASGGDRRAHGESFFVAARHSATMRELGKLIAPGTLWLYSFALMAHNSGTY
jgi:hypothetical protein